MIQRIFGPGRPLKNHDSSLPFIQIFTMNTNQVARRLVDLCRQGKFAEAQRELFSEDAVSIEPYKSPAFEKETKGLKAIQDKLQKWDQMVEKTHSVDVSDPLVAEQSFAVTMHLKVTMKEQGDMDMQELCVYKLKDGKIISEEFFQ